MVEASTVDRLVAAAERVGVPLEAHGDGPFLYIWANPAGEAVYVGKGVTERRLENEIGWRRQDATSKVMSGIVMLLRMNRAAPHKLHYKAERFDARRARQLRGAWDGPAFDELDQLTTGGPPSLDVVEELLVRIAVRYGTPLGNSQYHSQWESPIGRLADTLAVLAVTSDSALVIPDPIDTDEVASA